jgi:hypothetical protein
VQNAPTTIDDCWFMEGTAGDTAGYPSKKISGRGSENKWRLHRVMHFWKTPADLATDAGAELAHLCRRGRYDFAAGIAVACVNPHHTHQTSHATNLSHNQCANSCARLCPHQPKCIWTNDAGRRMVCRDVVPWPPAQCTCGNNCF